MMEAFGGRGLRCATAAELETAFQTALCGQSVIPTLIDVVLDPMAGVESGNVHAFNVPQKAKL
jgi:thiamine pyrophosphate-dependent acetolactate synthase large subunit-like protein